VRIKASLLSLVTVVQVKMPTFDIARIRAETPGTRHVIHLNNAGVSLMPENVCRIMQKYLDDETNFGGYEMEDKYALEHEKVYPLLAQLLHCKSNEIAITDSATTAWDRAFYALPLQRGDRILTSTTEYASNFIAYLQLTKRMGIAIDIIPNDEHGQICVEALEKMIDSHVRLISISHIPTNGGLVNPVAAIGKVARKHNIWYLIDACQSIGQVPIDVAEIGCDMLSGSGRKFLRGPRGTGFLFVSERMLEFLEPNSLDLHSAKWKTKTEYEFRKDARMFEISECNVAAKLGLTYAIQNTLDIGMENIWQRIQHLGQILRTTLSMMDHIQVQDLGKVKCGIVTFTVDMDGIDLFQLCGALRRRNVNTSVSVRDHTLIDMTARNLDHMIRASIHYFNTEDDIQTFCHVLEELIHAFLSHVKVLETK
jgi:cysteine desulfurase / selenocysteine lyase